VRRGIRGKVREGQKPDGVHEELVHNLGFLRECAGGLAWGVGGPGETGRGMEPVKCWRKKRGARTQRNAILPTILKMDYSFNMTPVIRGGAKGRREAPKGKAKGAAKETRKRLGRENEKRWGKWDLIVPPGGGEGTERSRFWVWGGREEGPKVGKRVRGYGVEERRVVVVGGGVKTCFAEK